VAYYEASRVVASPIHVLALGIAQALSPALMQAGFARSKATSRRPRLMFVLAFVPISLCYAMIVGWHYGPNPMQMLVPLAYVSEGLVLMALLAVMVPYFALPFRAEVVGAGSSRRLVGWVFASSVLHLAVVGAAIWELGAFAIPAGIIAGGVVETIAARWVANRLYTENDPAHQGIVEDRHGDRSALGIAQSNRAAR
jgi:hypothetical protein